MTAQLELILIKEQLKYGRPRYIQCYREIAASTMDKNGEYTTILNLMSGHRITAAIADDDYIAKLEVDEKVVWRLPLTFHAGAAMVHGTAVQWDTPEQGLMREQIWTEGPRVRAGLMCELLR
eukprot:scaffold16701_cov64-Cyclotella_meneghiniana.AAC.1